MTNIEQRPGNRDEHPLLTDRLLLPFDSQRKAVNEIISCFEHGIHSVYLFGEPRTGKTSIASLMSRHASESEEPNHVIFQIEADSNDGASQLQYFTDILLQLRHRQAEVGQVQGRGQRLVNHIAREAQTKSNSAVALIVFDEAQNLTIRNFKTWKSIWNKLKRMGVVTQFLLLGEPSLKDSFSRLSHNGDNALLTRFFSREYRMSLIESESQFKQDFGWYDSKHVYPKLSSKNPEPDEIWSCTRYFAPAAFEGGFRLASHTELIWKTLESALIERKISTRKMFVPVEYLNKVARYVLVSAEQSEIAKQPFVLNPEKLLIFIRKSGYPDYMAANSREG